MKHTVLMTALAASALAVPAVMAEGNSGTNTTTVRQDSQSSAVTTQDMDSMAKTAPAAGANSFTKTQATERLQEQGYSKVSDLKTDKNGIWRGTAMMNGKKQNVAVDYQGNITAN